jgi:hypothetical protein
LLSFDTVIIIIFHPHTTSLPSTTILSARRVSSMTDRTTMELAALLLCALLGLASAQPATLSIKGTVAVLINSLVTLSLDLTNAQCLTLYSSAFPGINLLYNTNGPCEWDREPPEVRPSGLK